MSDLELNDAGTLRDWFAGLALAGECATQGDSDAMLAERERRTEKAPQP